LLLKEIDLPQKHEYIEYKVVSDAHIGDTNFDEDLLKEDVNWAGGHKRLILNGDILNTATSQSVSDTYSAVMTPHEELKYARKLFSPVSEHIDSCTCGNHERRIYRSDGVDLAEELANTLNAAYDPDGILLKIRFGKKDNGKKRVYTLYHSHGSTSSRTSGGKANRLVELRNVVLSDIYVSSHSHELITVKRTIFVPDLYNNNVMEKEQTFVKTGAYLKYGGYGEMKSYPPTKRGTPTIRMYAKEKKVEVIV